MVRTKWYNFLIGGVFILLFSFLGTLALTPLMTNLLRGDRYHYFIGVNLSFLPFILSIVSVELIYHKKRYSINFKKVTLGFFAWFILLIIILLVTLLTKNPNLIKTYKTPNFYIMLLLSIFLTPVQTLSEEIIFRGYLLNFFKSIKNNFIFPLILSSGIFASLHLFNPEVGDNKILFFFAYLSMSLLLGYLTLKYKTIEYSFAIHLANNLFAINIVNYPDSPLPTYPLLIDNSPIDPLWTIIQTLIFSVIIIILIKKLDKFISN